MNGTRLYGVRLCEPCANKSTDRCTNQSCAMWGVRSMGLSLGAVTKLNDSEAYAVRNRMFVQAVSEFQAGSLDAKPVEEKSK